MANDIRSCSINRIIAQTVRKLRTEKKLSQETLANLSDLDRTYISLIERSRRNVTFGTLEKLLPHLSCCPMHFFQMLEDVGMGVCTERLREKSCPRGVDPNSPCFAGGTLCDHVPLHEAHGQEHLKVRQANAHLNNGQAVTNGAAHGHAQKVLNDSMSGNAPVESVRSSCDTIGNSLAVILMSLEQLEKSGVLSGPNQMRNEQMSQNIRRHSQKIVEALASLRIEGDEGMPLAKNHCATC